MLAKLTAGFSEKTESCEAQDCIHFLVDFTYFKAAFINGLYLLVPLGQCLEQVIVKKLHKLGLTCQSFMLNDWRNRC
jgi:hypothetical protein